MNPMDPIFSLALLIVLTSLRPSPAAEGFKALIEEEREKVRTGGGEARS